MYVTADDKSTFDLPFDIAAIPVVTKEQADAEDRTKKLTTVTPTIKAPKAGPTKAAPTGAEASASASAAAQKYQQELLKIPEMKAYGSVLKSSPVVELTESETEYVVSVVKHIFKEHIVLQYEVKNTLPDTVLEEVSIVATPSDEEELEEDFIIPAAKLATDEPGTIYVSFKKNAGEASFPSSSFTNVLKFTTKEIDPTTGEPEETGYDDEYQVEDLELTGSDYVVPAFAGNFSHIWEQVGAAGEEAEETLQLSGVKSIAGKLLTVSDIMCNHANICQMQPSNSPRLFRYSPLREQMCRSMLRSTPSSFSARQLLEAEWLRTFGWHIRRNQASRVRSQFVVRRKVLRLWSSDLLRSASEVTELFDAFALSR
jgi:coatomer protein complex subunit gamma